MKSLNKIITTFLILLSFTININAQGSGNVDGDTTGTNEIPGNCGHGPNAHVGNAQCHNDRVPLDGGLSILLLGAAAFGIKKLRKK